MKAGGFSRTEGHSRRTGHEGTLLGEPGVERS